jgi:hypothetical protein
MTDPDPGSALLAPSIDDRTITCPVCKTTFPAPPHGSPDATVTTLLAVCDVLVVKALEKMGNYIVRASRNRYNEIGDRPYYLAHTLWPATDEIVTKALKGAWDVVPIVLETYGPQEFDTRQAVGVLNKYVHDLVVAGEPHDNNVLAYRLRSGLGLPVFHVVQAS